MARLLAEMSVSGWSSPRTRRRLRTAARSHFEETAELMGRTSGDFPKYPRLFMRSPMSHVGHGEPVVVPTESDQLDYEGEIAVIIGRECHRVPARRALDYGDRPRDRGGEVGADPQLGEPDALHDIGVV
jgi:2-keto-4-pentenoate hydratase/2-oxohepta-3-ene-1,7-dioic acid hydratase in catechol pathway